MSDSGGAHAFRSVVDYSLYRMCRGKAWCMLPRLVRAKFLRGLTIAAVDIQLLMLRCPLRTCAPVGAPLMFRGAAERD